MHPREIEAGLGGRKGGEEGEGGGGGGAQVRLRMRWASLQ
jgi:hypothetical protein